eukprot:c7118_g1_i1 orf=918-3254(+)
MEIQEIKVSHATSEDEAFLEFLSVYPSYRNTVAIDTLRHKEYPHLDEEGHVCLDYTGVGLFSRSQRNPELYGGFGIGLSPTSANLATHAMYMEGGSTEGFFRNRILRYLNLDEDCYYIVFTANALSAFKLLGESYPFHEAPNLLLAYDHQCENLEAIGDCAHAKGALVQSTNLANPSRKIDKDDLRKRLQGKRKVSTKGLFAYPYTSCVTGCRNSSQWIPEAQQNGWHVLLDVTSADAKFSGSLGLALFLPDFVICSFYYVFGEDPTGFGCLAIKKSALRTLGDSSRARAIGMVKIVSKHAASSSPDDSPESSGRINDPHKKLLKESLGHKRSLSVHGFSFQAESSAESATINNPASRRTQDDIRCFKASIPHKKDKDRATLGMKVAGPSRMHRDALGFAKHDKSLKSTSSGVESGKENGSSNMSSRLSRNSESDMQSEVVTSSSPCISIVEIKEMEPMQSHGFASVNSNEGTTEWEDVPKRKDRGDDSFGHGPSKSSLKHDIILKAEPLVQEASYSKSSEESLRGEPSSQNTTEDTIAIDNWVATSNAISTILGTPESGTGEVPSRQLESASRPLTRDGSLDMHFTCRGLDHADMVGGKCVAIRLRMLVNWLISSLSRLRHPQPGNILLVRICSPMTLSERGSTIAFTISGPAGNVLCPKTVQMLADRSSISLRTGILTGTLSSVADARDTEDESRDGGCVEISNYKWRAKGEAVQNVQIPIVCASLGFLNNFSDVYRLWLFISKFLDPDFVSQEQWHYQALNQETISIGPRPLVCL